MQQAFRQKHHNLSTVGEHTLRVARASLSICYALRRLNIAADIPTVVTGSLCHDLGLLGQDEKYSSMMECSIKHPVDAVEVARKLVGELPQKTADVITRHMWPVNGGKPPNSLEGAVVSVADKIATFEDYVEGLKEKSQSIRGGIQNLMNRKSNRD